MNKPYHSYIFFETNGSLVELSQKTLGRYTKEFLKIVNAKEDINIESYELLGFKKNIRFMLWLRYESIEKMQTFLATLLRSNLGRHCTLAYTLFGMVRQSTYARKQNSQEQAVHEISRLPYLIVYPFTKTTEWYMLDFETRKTMMTEHMKIGHKHITIRQILLYAYGIDDHEFILSYETESLADFQSLIIDLRSTQARKYTQNDLPIFTCVHKPITTILEHL